MLNFQILTKYYTKNSTIENKVKNLKLHNTSVCQLFVALNKHETYLNRIN